MKVIVMIKATASSEAGLMPDEVLLTAMGRFNEELVQAGVMQAGEGLKPSREGVRVHLSGESRSITHGPFGVPDELVAGFWIWEVSSLDEAVHWVQRCPNPMPEDSEIEIRPVYEMEDFAACDPTGELMADEQKLREQLDVREPTDEQQILDLISRWTAALERRDVAAMLENYAEDVVLYDVKPPYQVQGIDGVRGVWEACLPHFPETFRSEHRDLQVHVRGDVAFVHGLHHFVPEPPEHPCGQSWVRVTIGYQRVDGDWEVVHEHASLPFDPMTSQVCAITDPASGT